MDDDFVNSSSLALAGIAPRYPKETHYLSRVFNDTTNSYKLLWFLALLSLLKQGYSRKFRMDDVFCEMVVEAWHPVCLFRLSLGLQDHFQNVILDIQQSSGLPSKTKPEKIRRYVKSSKDAQSKLTRFSRYVPTRFLAPWFADKLRGVKDDKKAEIIKALAFDSQKTQSASLYYFGCIDGCESVTLNNVWLAFLKENRGIVQAFVEYNFARYLQARNPNVPGVINKLHAPAARKLTSARKFWETVRSGLYSNSKSSEFCDIYSGQQLDEGFSIDHFLPWSFVAHDLLWNLTPVESKSNSSKSDNLPDLPLYLPRLARLHFSAIDVVKCQPNLLQDYIECFKVNPIDLLAMGEKKFCAKYRDVILPQALIARNQGFIFGWKYAS